MPAPLIQMVQCLAVLVGALATCIIPLLVRARV